MTTQDGATVQTVQRTGLALKLAKQWMGGFSKQELEDEANLGGEAEAVIAAPRQARLGLGAAYVPHNAAVQVRFGVCSPSPPSHPLPASHTHADTQAAGQNDAQTPSHLDRLWCRCRGPL